MMKFNSIGLKEFPLTDSDSLNLDKIKERSNKIANMYENELVSALVTDYTVDEAISFVESQVNRILIKK